MITVLSTSATILGNFILVTASFLTLIILIRVFAWKNLTGIFEQRAEKIADNAGSSLGNLKKATMGVIQITAPNSNEDYSYGRTYNTTSKDKEASITIKLEYEVD